MHAEYQFEVMTYISISKPAGHEVKPVKNEPVYRGSSSVLFAYSFLLLFGRFDNIYKVEQDSLYFFFERGFKRIYLREKKFYPFVCGFRDMNF